MQCSYIVHHCCSVVSVSNVTDLLHEMRSRWLQWDTCKIEFVAAETVNRIEAVRGKSEWERRSKRPDAVNAE